MFINLILIGYSMLWFLFGVITWGFADANLPFRTIKFLYDFVNFQRSNILALYSFFVLAFFLFYGLILWYIWKKNLTVKHILILVVSIVIILIFSFPAFSYDIFNYIATAKVVFLYKENPYVVMPIEVPNESMLAFMHAANKTALYGPAWILLTGVPFFLGAGNLLTTIFTFKLITVSFYLALLWLIWKISNRSIYSLALFALNPLVIIETLISSHNDVVMMFFALMSFYMLQKKKIGLSIMLMLVSILVKFATLALVPVYIYTIYLMRTSIKINWLPVWKWSSIFMLIVFFLSPLREEIYAWYLIWPLTFVVLLGRETFLLWLLLGFSFGLSFRIAPFIYTRNWGGFTPLVKKIVTFIPPVLTGFYYAIRKKN